MSVTRCFSLPLVRCVDHLARGATDARARTLKTMSVVMYVKPGCPYCSAAREHLATEGVVVEERDATSDPAWKAELMAYTNDRGVVPTLERDGSVQVGFPPGRG